MNILVASLLGQPKKEYDLTLTDRIPFFLESPCQVHCQLSLVKESSYYLLTMELTGTLSVVCQRCGEVFTKPLQRTTTLALCDTEEQAESLMSEYDPIVLSRGGFDLTFLVTDDLLLYTEAVHEENLCRSV